MTFQVFISPFFGEIISRYGVKLDQRELKVLSGKHKGAIESLPWNNLVPE